MIHLPGHRMKGNAALISLLFIAGATVLAIYNFFHFDEIANDFESRSNGQVVTGTESDESEKTQHDLQTNASEPPTPSER